MLKGKMIEDALQIVEKRRKAKGKGEKERYIHLNAEFQRIARRDKKSLLKRTMQKKCKHGNLLQTCPTLCDLMGYSLPGSSVHGILQARILEWFALL